MSTWKPVTDEIKRKVLVTNNLDARDSFGQMSHIWVADGVWRDSDHPGQFCTFDGMQKIWGVRHYAEIPSDDGQSSND